MRDHEKTESSDCYLQRDVRTADDQARRLSSGQRRWETSWHHASRRNHHAPFPCSCIFVSFFWIIILLILQLLLGVITPETWLTITPLTPKNFVRENRYNISHLNFSPNFPRNFRMSAKGLFRGDDHYNISQPKIIDFLYG